MINTAITASVFLLLWSVLPAVAASPALEEVPCPEKMECVLVDTFTKADGAPEQKKYPISVPRYTDELTLSLEKGSRLQVILEREAAGR